ncbi:hypothetical protein D3C74_435400 [compost metagenome]
MGNRSSYDWNVNQVFLGVFNAFADGVRNFAGFTDTCTDIAVAVAHNNKCAKAETASAFYNFCYTVNVYNSFCQL